MKEQVIYKIINLIDGKFYVGSTTNKPERFRTHRSMLRGNRHHSPKLQAAWNKHGENNFVFKVIDVIPEDKSLQDAEDVWLIEHVGKKYCYNTGYRSNAPWRGCPKGSHPNYGKPRSTDARQAVSNGLKLFFKKYPEQHPRLGKKHTEETKAKIRANRTGIMTGEKHYRYGKTVPDEVKKKIGDTQRGVPKGEGRKVSEEGMAKIKAAAEQGHYDHWKGRNHTEESRDKMGKAILEVTTNKEFATITKAGDFYDMPHGTIRRSIVSNKPILKGKNKGLLFAFK